MISPLLRTQLLGPCLLLAVIAHMESLSYVSGQESQRLAAAEKLYQEGNYAEALADFQNLLLETGITTKETNKCLAQAVSCLQQLNRYAEVDALLEQVAVTHSGRWQVLAELGRQYTRLEHHGAIVAGSFERGPQRGATGQVVNSFARDRCRALQLYRRAVEMVENDPEAQKASAAVTLLQSFAAALLEPVQVGRAWRLQELTPLDDLPDYEEGWNYYNYQRTGAPVDEEGNPVLYEAPNSWQAAHSDGERWRWVLTQIPYWQPERGRLELVARAEFLQSQFGTQTLAEMIPWWSQRQVGEDPGKESGTYALHTLGDDETIARLAVGIRRFSLPEEHNHVKLWQRIAQADEEQNLLAAQNLQDSALARLAGIYENRRQFPRAAEYWRKLASLPLTQQQAQPRLQQIEGNWGRFETVAAQPTPGNATVDFRFRNGKRVEFVARRVKLEQLLADLKAYLKSKPAKLDWDKLQIENLGYRLITKQQEKYVGEEVARWSADLEPAERHFDKRITITTPLQNAGVYLLTSTMVDGNTCHVVMWLNNTVIVKKPLEGKSLYFVADSKTGKPIPKCNLEMFGYWQQHLDGNNYRIETKQFAAATDENGLATVAADEKNRPFQWLVTATMPGGRFAYLGFSPLWFGQRTDERYQQVKAFAVTDRPVYRPGQKVQFKIWVAEASYDLQEESRYSAKSFQVEIRDPRNERVYSTQIISDVYGGITGSWDVPEGATLGQYQLSVVNHGGGTFRIEEYKKPEYEVKVETPNRPVALGEKFTAKISANYYFGAPVTSAKVHYKVTRTSESDLWYPPAPWDWLYGRGYGWFAQDYTWYPGWSRWGCPGPTPSWMIWRQPQPPELVADTEVPIGPDGTVDVEIDTSVAKQFFPDEDHTYQIQAEVVDESRRTIVGSGSVIVSKDAFRVVLRTDRGHYRTGDTITASVWARTVDGKPVAGSGVLRLLKINYENAQPVEVEAGRWELTLGELGSNELPLKANDQGQFRLTFQMTDDEGHTAEGARIITIAGPDFNGSDFRFNDLEVIPDKRDYRVGDTASLRINVNEPGATALLFIRPTGGTYTMPRVLKLQGKSTLEELAIQAGDMPNIFVEAVVVHQGKVHTVNRELLVPPVERILRVEVVPGAEAYLPSQEASLALRVTDELGKPFVGSLVMAVYDKAVDYIAGGSNVGDIRAFFWKWRRDHRPQGETNVERYGYPLAAPGKPEMENLGPFGDVVVGDFAAQTRADSDEMRRGGVPMKMALELSAEAPMAEAEPLFEASRSAVVADIMSPDQDTQFVEPVIRSNFADTAFWQANLVTNADGLAEVKFPLPENLTTWKIRTWGMGTGTRVGEGSAEFVTRKNLIVRLQAPRFFVERDEVVLSANVHNYLATDKAVTVQLDLGDSPLEGLAPLERQITVPSQGEERVDWRVRVTKEGVARIRVSALTDEESDAVEQTYPVLVHGFLKTDSFAGVMRPADTNGSFEISIPSERRAEHTRLEVRYSPTLAGAMVDALPYLIDYPYGCTEQTLNRFLPAVITQQTLKRTGVDLAAIREKRVNLNAQEIGDPDKRASQWKRYDRNPVFNEDELAEIVQAGLNRLTEMQLADGGWGWFSGYGEHSTAHTTAIVVHGLTIAEKNGVALVPGVLEKGVAWLRKYQAEQLQLLNNYEANESLSAEQQGLRPSKPFADNLDALVLMVLSERLRSQTVPTPLDETHLAMTERLFRDRTHLAVYSLATFGYALHLLDDTERLATVMRNLSQYVEEDDENQTAWLNLPAEGWWYWYGSEFEAHAYYLKLLAAHDPTNSVAPRLVKYLLNGRKHASYWNSTRDTALVIEALADYLQASGEMNPDMEVEIWIDGQQRQKVHIDKSNLFSFDNSLVLAGEELTPGAHTVELRKTGDAPLYYNAYVSNFTLEDQIEASGLELRVERKFYKLVKADKQQTVAGARGQVVEEQAEKYDRVPVTNLAELTSGDLVEVEFKLDSKNDYEYLLVEDSKAAGFEPVEVRSGYTDNELGAYVEFHDERVALFLRTLSRGRHSMSYRIRAEVPGLFSALPARISAMYAPELRGNSREIKLRIVD